MNRLITKHILLGVTGSIAAYKSADVLRRLRQAGAKVRVVMTRAANEFVTPLTFQALSGNPVHHDLLDVEAEAGMGHIELARWADAVMVAPASADFIARLAQGRADDLLSTICLASQVPVIIAPAMNSQMWQNPATQDNISSVSGRGIIQLGPDAGEQACGEVGPGRMLEPQDIVMRLAEVFVSESLTGKTVLVTAGPTQEAIDPVRFISNRSSGKMGYCVAAAAQEAGARVKLISGPVSLQMPERVERTEVESAQDMLEVAQQQIRAVDIFIAVAAVADYRPVTVYGDKLKKTADRFSLELERTPDILTTLKSQFPSLYCVGFAAETSSLDTNARDKLYSKGVDLIAANWVGPAALETTQGCFGSDSNALRLYWDSGELELALTSKEKLARQLIAVIAQRFQLYKTQTRLDPAKVVSIKNAKIRSK